MISYNMSKTLAKSITDSNGTPAQAIIFTDEEERIINCALSTMLASYGKAKRTEANVTIANKLSDLYTNHKRMNYVDSFILRAAVLAIAANHSGDTDNKAELDKVLNALYSKLDSFQKIYIRLRKKEGQAS